MFRSRRPATIFPALAAAALASSCGATLRTPDDPSHGSAVEATALAAPVLLPTYDTTRVVGTSDNGTRFVIAGPIRAQLAPNGSVRLGDDRFVAPIADAFHVGPTRWMFLAQDGSLAASDSGFLGALRPMGVLHHGGLPAADSPGLVVVMQRDGSVLATDGVRPLAPLHGPGGNEPLTDAAFVDPMNGLAVTDGGALFVTRDGAANWTALDLAGEAAWQVRVHAGRLVADTTGGTRALDGSALVPDAPGGPAATDAHDAPLSSAAAQSVLAAMRARFTGLLAGGLRVRSRSGTVLSIEPGGLVQYDAASGRTVDAVHLPDLSHCTVAPWGQDFGAVCAQAVFRIGPGGVVAQPLASAPSNVVFSDDGIHAAGVTCCDERFVRAGRRTRPIEIGTVSAITRTVLGFSPTSLRAVRPVVLGMHGALALVRTARQNQDDPLGLYLLDTDRGAITRLRLERAWQGRRVAVREVHFAPDGSLAGVAVVAAGDDTAPLPAGPVLLAGSANGPLVLRALPRGADDAGFVDALRGVAVGASTRELYRTADGGRSWHASPLASRGADKPLPFTTRDADGTARVECTAEGCLVGASVWFGATGPAPTGALLAGPSDDDDGDESATHEGRFPSNQGGTDAASDVATELAPGRFQCNGIGAPVPSLLRVGSTAQVGHLGRTLLMPGVDSVLEEWLVRGTLTARYRWRGADARGAFDGASTTAPLGVNASAEDIAGGRFPPRWSLWAATRAGALLERGFEPTAARASEVVWAAPHAPLMVVHDATAFAARTGLRLVVDGAQPLASGGVALLLTSRAPDPSDAMIDVLVVLGPDGRVRSRRAFAYAHPRVHALASAQGGAFVGYATARADAPRAFDLIALDPATAPVRRLATIPAGALNACGAPSPNATDLFLTHRGYAPLVRVAAQVISTPIVATLELDGRGACLRGVASRTPVDAPRPTFGAGVYLGPPRGLQLTVGADGSLSGFWDDGANTQILGCTH